jgi:hypothetical protein
VIPQRDECHPIALLRRQGGADHLLTFGATPGIVRVLGELRWLPKSKNSRRALANAA